MDYPDFTNTKLAFAYLSEKEVKKAVFLFSFLTKPFWVKTGKMLLAFVRFLHIPYAWAVRRNIFRHFCGGETIEQCEPVIQKLALFNCRSILDYSAEGLQGEANFDSVCSEILSTINKASLNKNIAFGVFKFTGMVDFSLLEKISSGSVLTTGDHILWKNALKRTETIFTASAKFQHPVFVDAEETWIQPAIDKMTMDMMQKFNRNSAIVFTTVQMYRIDGLEKVRQLIEHAKNNSYISGVKLVRGAYMEKERERAEKFGYPSPVHPTKAETDKAFNDAVGLCLSASEYIHVCIATHNEQSCLDAVKMMEKFTIDKNDRRIWFAQLFGMSDHITFNLAHMGYNTAKYLPYGPVAKVMPYLVRRAEENSSVSDQSNREIVNLRNELKRRMKK